MADRGGRGSDMERLKQQYPQATSTVRQVVKATTAVTLGGSLLTLSGLLLVGTVISLAIATPLLVLFSPVLVPAVITVGLIMTGFLASGGFGVAAVTAFTFMYKSVMGQQPAQGLAARAQHMPQQLAHKAKDAMDQMGQQTGTTRSIL